MSYEIPQQLQHKERIMFGLTFEQLGWVAFFGGISLKILLSKGNLGTNIVLAIIPAILGIAFVYCDALQWIMKFWKYICLRNLDLESKKIAHILNINKVENDILYAKREIAILEIEPLNFSIMQKDHQEIITAGFQKFINSLEHPIQMLITTQELNLQEYYESVQKNAKDAKTAEEFVTFNEELIKKNNARNRKFYIIIPKCSDLSIQVAVCQSRLTTIGLKSKRLSTSDILSFLKKYLGASDNADIKSVVNDLHRLIAPTKIVASVDSLIVNDTPRKYIGVSGYPRTVQSGFLDKIISSTDDCDISIHVEPFSISSTMITLNKELQRQRADMYTDEKKQFVNPSLEIKYQDTRKVLEELQKGVEKLFNVSLYICCKGSTQNEVNLLSKKIEAELNALMMIPYTPYLQQIQAYQSMLPIALDTLKIKRNITTKALSAFFPFTAPFLSIEKQGIMLGLNKNKIPVIKDIYSHSNANGMVLATSGAGKSYFTKLFIARQRLLGTKVIVIDPQSEYLALTSKCKGQTITISKNSATIINPLDLMGHDFIEKRLALMDVFSLMLGELTEVQRSILDKAVAETYLRKGFSQDSTKYKKPPILSDLYAVLTEMNKKATQLEKITYQSLLNRLYVYTDGVFQFLNRQTNIDAENDFVCFNIGEMPKQVKPVIMFLILDYVYMKMKQSKERKLLIVDEAWSLLAKAEEASYIFEIVKTCRKFNMGLQLITQDVADLVDSRAGKAVLGNSSYVMLLRQKPAIIDGVSNVFHLSSMEKEYLVGAPQGKGIFIIDNDHLELEIVASPEEHKLITTNADELLAASKPVQKELPSVDAQLDLEKGLYYGRDLTDDQKNYLLNHGYKCGNFMPIGKPRQEECWVKTNNVESLEHTFLVQNIKQEIIKYSIEVQINITEKPDIVCKKQDGTEIAFEVETGLGLKNHKKRIVTKFSQVSVDYSGRIYLVLTTSDLKYAYNKLLPTTPLILRTQLPELFKKLFNEK